MQVILRSGAYLTHDHGFYGAVSPAGRGTAGAPVLRPHPCTTLDKWRALVVLDDHDVVIDLVHCFSDRAISACITTAVTTVR